MVGRAFPTSRFSTRRQRDELRIGNPMVSGYGTLVPGLPDVQCPRCVTRLMKKPKEGRGIKSYRCATCDYQFFATREMLGPGDRPGPFLPSWPRKRKIVNGTAVDPPTPEEIDERAVVVRAFRVVRPSKESEEFDV